VLGAMVLDFKAVPIPNYIDINTDITSIGIGQLHASDTDISVEQFRYYEK